MKRKKEKDYEINVKLTVPLTVNVRTYHKKIAEKLAENLIRDFLEMDVWEGKHKECESGMVDQWGEIVSKTLSTPVGNEEKI